jgi:predicted N-acetyltransferase YhbS
VSASIDLCSPHPLAPRLSVRSRSFAILAHRLGTRLLRRVEEAVAERGCAVADVYPGAEDFYRKLGWSAPTATLLKHRLV